MKHLAVFLLVCLSLASAVPLYSNDLELNKIDDLLLSAEGGDRIGERLKELFENMVERMKKAFEDGKGVRGDLFKKAQDVDKLKNMGVEISEKIKEVFENLRNKVSQNGGGIGERLNEVFEKMVEKLRKAFEDGEGVREDVLKKAQDLYDKLKNMGVEISDRVKEMFEDLKNKVNKNGPTNAEIDGFPLYEGGISERLKELFERMVEKLRKSFEDGEGVRIDVLKKAQDLYDKLKNMGVEISDRVKEIFEDLKNKVNKNGPTNAEIDGFSLYEGGIGERLKELFERMVESLKKTFEDGGGVREDVLKKAQDLYDKLKNMGVEISDRVKEIFEDLKNKVNKNGPTSSNADISNIFDMFKRLRELVKEKLDADELKAKVEKIFGKGSELAKQIINMLKEKGGKGKKKVLDWIDRVIPDKEERSISEVHEKIREFFKDLHIDLKERFTKFGEWVKEQYEKGLEKGKTKAENIKRIAKEFLKSTKAIGKNMAQEALDFFKEHKSDLGNLYDEIVDKVRKVLKS